MVFTCFHHFPRAECLPEQMLWLKSDMKHFGSSTGTSDSCLQIVRIVAIRLECQESQGRINLRVLHSFYHLNRYPAIKKQLSTFFRRRGHASEDPTVDATQIF